MASPLPPDEVFDWRPRAVLDPVERASEIVFGTLMAMSITGTLSVATAGRHEVLSMTVAALGCNLAWGLTDAVMYLVGTLTSRRREARLLALIQAATTEAEAHRLIADSLSDQLAASAGPAVLQPLYHHLRTVPIPAAHLLPRDYSAALGILILVVTVTFPVVLPFFLCKDPTLALRLSNLCAVTTLFLAGRTLGIYADGHPLRYGVGMSCIGLVLVGIIIALGG